MTVTNSFEVRGPYRSNMHQVKTWMYEIYDDGALVADVYNQSQQVALENALLLAAAPRMADLLECLNVMEIGTRSFIINLASAILSSPIQVALEIGNTYAESQGVKCEACDTLGQPSRMTYSPMGRLYHATCVPESVKAAIEAEDLPECS